MAHIEIHALSVKLAGTFEAHVFFPEQEVEKADLTNVLIDKAQMGLACIDSWSAVPEPEFRMPYGDYDFTFIMTPVSHSYPLY